MYYNNELYHFGVKGQKWGQRRYQNKDGSYKSGAEGRYDGDGSNGPKRTLRGNLHRLAASNYSLNARTYSKLGNKTMASMNKAAATRSLKKAQAADLAAQKKRDDKIAAKENKRNEKAAAKEQKRISAENKRNEKAAAKEAKQANKKEFHLSDRQKKALKVGAAVGASVLAAYGAKKLYDHLDATHKGKLIAQKMISDAGGDFEKAGAAYNERLRQYHWDKSTGALGKYAKKSGQILEGTRKGLADAVRKHTYENSATYKDLQAIKAASRARRKEQFDKATKGLRVGSERIVSKAKSGSDAVRSRSGDIATRVRSKAGEAAKNARSAYERNAGKRMANSINRSYARKQAVGKAKTVAENAASRMRSAAKSGASRVQEYAYNKSMERTRNKYSAQVARDLRRRGRL